MQTLTIAVLLHKRRMVSLASLDFTEMGRCLLAAIAGGAAAGLLAWGLGNLFRHLPGIALLHHTRYWTDAAILIAGIALWTAMAAWVLEKAGSALPKVAMRRLGIGEKRTRVSTP
jgi:putative peptidoglycan lipid II flippase